MGRPPDQASRGWVKLHRQVTDSAIYRMPPLYLRVFERLIIEANHTDRDIPYRMPGGAMTTRSISRGSRLTSLRQIATWVGWYERNQWKTPAPRKIREILHWLAGQNMIILGNPSPQCKGIDLDGETPRLVALPNDFPNDFPNTRETYYTLVNYEQYQSGPNDLANDFMPDSRTEVSHKQELRESTFSSPQSSTESQRVPQTGKPQKRSPKQTDPRVKPVIDHFCGRYLAEIGMPYPVHGARDGALVKGQPQAYTTDVLCNLVDLFFREKDPYTWEKRGPTIPSFIDRIPALNTRLHTEEVATCPCPQIDPLERDWLPAVSQPTR